MKTHKLLQSLHQRLRQWQQYYQVLCHDNQYFGLFRCISQRYFYKIRRRRIIKLVKSINRKFIRKLSLFLTTTNQQQKTSNFPVITNNQQRIYRIDRIIYNWIHRHRSLVILVCAILSLTSLTGYQLYNQPQVQLGNIALETFIAPYTDKIENKEETEIKRQEASKKSVPILIIDPEINRQINQNLAEIIKVGNTLRNTVGLFPFFDSSLLSIPTQNYLRSCSDEEWQKIQLTLVNNLQNKPKQKNNLIKPLSSFPLLGSSENIINNQNNKNFNFTQVITELQTYQIMKLDQKSSQIIKEINEVRKSYQQGVNKLSQLEGSQFKRIYRDTLILELTDDNWEKTQTGISQSLQRILTQGIAKGIPLEIRRDAINLQIQSSVPIAAEPLASRILLEVVKPNLKQDEIQTQQQAEQAAQQVEAVMVEVKAGDIIVKKGEKINNWNLEVLEHYKLISHRINWIRLTILGLCVTLAISIFVWCEHKSRHYLRQRDRFLILLLTLTVPGALAIGLSHSTWSGIGLLLGSFYSPTMGITVLGLLAIIIPIGTDINKIALLAGTAGGIFSGYMAHKRRSREELALLGIATALIQGGTYLLLEIIIKICTGNIFHTPWYIIFQEASLCGIYGLTWSIIALGISPYLEKVFDLITPIRLAEIANPNLPLLKKLATETPGTFQHTLLVATLAEAAAKELKCNVELVRAGTLYHDIGKMHDPLGFIENQMGGENKHETQIKDPWESASIIKKHVTEGLKMAKKHKLPTAIQAFIPEHQGTMTIAYFYHQAQEIAKNNPEKYQINEADFRYDGPIPQSRETGIVMLADSCEAALRSLKDGTPEKALNMLNNILKARWEDGQLVQSGLSREEMSKIAQIFVDVWQQFHHKRIAYPKMKQG